jgi:hypothetical protein
VEERRKWEEEAVEVKRKADKEAERKWKEEEKKKVDNERYQREVVKQKEEYERKQANKVVREKKEEEKQKKEWESMLRKLWGRMMTTMGPGPMKWRAQEQGVRGMTVKLGPPGPSKAPATPDGNGYMCPHCKAGGHKCLWDKNKTCLKCCGMHLG